MVDSEYLSIMTTVQKKLEEESKDNKVFKLPKFIIINDPEYSNVNSIKSEDSELNILTDYVSLLQSGDSNFKLLECKDEWDAITLNYTSGTTGNPKGNK